MAQPISVVLAAVVQEKSIVMIKRIKNPFKGYWSLPGGKIEDEFLSQAAIREVKEETNMATSFVAHLGVVSEQLYDKEHHVGHWILHFCKLNPESSLIKSGSEGEVKWFTFDEIRSMQEKIIPSDYAMIESMLLQGKTGYYNSKITKSGDIHLLETFERLSS